MNTRATGILMLSLIGLPLILFGAEQYGHAFLGLLAGLGAFAKMIGAQSPIWMIVFPLLTIFMMILFSTAGITAIGYSVIQILGCKKTFIQHKKAKFIPMIFSLYVLTGLVLLSTFPGEPVTFVSITLFFFPSAVLIVSIINALQKQ